MDNIDIHSTHIYIYSYSYDIYILYGNILCLCTIIQLVCMTIYMEQYI